MLAAGRGAAGQIIWVPGKAATVMAGAEGRTVPPAIALTRTKLLGLVRLLAIICHQCQVGSRPVVRLL